MRRAAIRWTTIAAGVTGASCSHDAPRSRDHVAASVSLPRLQYMAASDTGSGPLATSSNVAVGPRGEVLITDYDGAPVPLRLIDLARHTDSGIAHHGEGPGEIRYAMPMLVTDSSVLAWDLANWRVTEWSRDNRVIASYQLRSTLTLAAALDTRHVIGVRQRSEGSFPVIIDLGSGRIDDIVSPQDTSYQRLFGIAGERLENLPVIGAWSNGVFIGDNIAYRIALYDWHGKLVHVIDRQDIGSNLPTARAVAKELSFLRATGRARAPADVERARARLAATAIAWFSRLGPPQSDAHGRLWVVGTHNDSTFADVFAETQFLGRIWLDCKDFGGRWSMNGEWIALPCAPDDPGSEREAVVKVWRVMER